MVNKINKQKYKQFVLKKTKNTMDLSRAAHVCILEAEKEEAYRENKNIRVSRGKKRTWAILWKIYIVGEKIRIKLTIISCIGLYI